MYPDPSGELSKHDLGQMPWTEFMKTLNNVVMKYFASMEAGARMGILMGDVRRNGHLYSMLTDIVKPGELEQIIIKYQHNCVSEGRTYSHKKFVPLVHEYGEMLYLQHYPQSAVKQGFQISMQRLMVIKKLPRIHIGKIRYVRYCRCTVLFTLAKEEYGRLQLDPLKKR